jgi:cytochrome P450
MHGTSITIYQDLYIYWCCCRAILHDPEIYPDPDEFRPERFLEKDRSFRDDPAISLAYGAGKRICPGRHLVDATLFIVTSSVLSVFNIARAKDENGHEIPVRAAMSVRNGLVAYVSDCHP